MTFFSEINDYQFPVFASFFLFFAMIFYWFSLAFPKNSSLFFGGKYFVVASNFLFVLTLSSRWIHEGYFPLSNLYESLIFLSWGISSLHLYVEFKTKSRLIGALASPLLFILSGFSSLTLPIEMQKALPLVPSLQSNWLMMHVSMMMVSYATLIVGSLFSILYLFLLKLSFRLPTSSLSFPFGGGKETTTIQESFETSFEQPQGQERKESLSSFSSIVSSSPSRQPAIISPFQQSLLETVDIWSYRIIGLGFPFLTIGIISGAVWANEAWGSYWSWDPKETWALITWLVFAIYLHSRLLKGWQGEKAALLGSAGFFVIWICYLGVNFLGKGLHSYGWVL